MLVRVEARQLLWGAIPQRLGDNRKSWLAYAAHVLGWRPRRVRAVWNGEARVISADEMRQLEARYALQQERAERRRKDRDDLHNLSTARGYLPVAERAAGPGRQEADRDRALGARQGRLPFGDEDRSTD